MDIANLGGFFNNAGNALVNKANGATNEYFKALSDLIEKYSAGKTYTEDKNNSTSVEGKAAGTQWKTKWSPVLDFSLDGSGTWDNESASRKIGFTIAPDGFANTTVSVYRSEQDSLFRK